MVFCYDTKDHFENKEEHDYFNFLVMVFCYDTKEHCENKEEHDHFNFLVMVFCLDVMDNRCCDDKKVELSFLRLIIRHWW